MIMLMGNHDYDGVEMMIVIIHLYSLFTTMLSTTVYEVVKTVTTIYPNIILLDTAATSISRFIRSDSHNLKYIGIKGLAAIVKDHPKYDVYQAIYYYDYYIIILSSISSIYLSIHPSIHP